MYKKNLKKELLNGKAQIGCWLNLGNSVSSEIVGLAGFDWVLIDLEHGSGNECNVLHQLQALEHTSTSAIVRVESIQRQRIHRVLDMGARGVMCPRINTPNEANHMAKGLRYPVKGVRGVAKMVRATGFGENFEHYHANQENSILGIAQIETIEALDHLDEIANTDGIDVLFIGPADLSMELEIFGQFDHPRFSNTVREIINAAQKSGKVTGILTPTPELIPKYHEQGIRMIASGADSAFVSTGARRTVDMMRKFTSS